MDVQSQIASKRMAGRRARELAQRLSGEDKTRALVFAAELEFQADILENQLVLPSLPEPSNSNDADPRPKAARAARGRA